MIALAIYLIFAQTDYLPAWYFWVEGIFAGLFFLYEGTRTYYFEKSTHKQEDVDVRTGSINDDREAMLNDEPPQARFYAPE